MTPDTTPPSREQLLYWLHEAAEIEHHLMCCYLYAAFSLKRADPRWTEAQGLAVQGWRSTIMSVVFEEMTHLALVGNLLAGLISPSKSDCQAHRTLVTIIEQTWSCMS
jgi:Mn-containing catalase